MRHMTAGITLCAVLVLGTTVVEAQLRPVPLRPSSGSVGSTAILPGGSGNTLNFDPKRLGEKNAAGEAASTPAGSAAATPVDEIIDFKHNDLAKAKCRKIPLDTKINIDFQEAPLEDLTKWISCATEKNFIIASLRSARRSSG